MNAQTSKQPSHKLFQVQGDGQNAVWRQIGACWEHADGKGFSIACDVIPLKGRLVVRVAKPASETAEQGRLA